MKKYLTSFICILFAALTNAQINNPTGYAPVAGTTITNANLTGPITSAGNATAIASQTGTGSKFVMDTGPVLIAPALGTPASGIATNLTGTAAGLTAGAVTTNANLTGVITSVGNATSIASQTGTGTKFVVDTSPTLVTPNIGTPSAGVVTNLTGTASININGSVGASTPNTVSATSLISSGDITLSATDGKIIGGTTTGREIVGNSDTTTYSIFYGATHPTNAGQILEVAASTAVGLWKSSGLSVTGSVNTTGAYKIASSLLFSASAPSISSGFGTSPAILSNNGTATFRVDVGTGGTASSGVIAMPTSAAGWNCNVSEFNPNSIALLSTTVITASSSTTVTIQNDLLSTGAATAWQASQVIIFICSAY